jgi:O-antigen/teichoic acid export membrane protein
VPEALTDSLCSRKVLKNLRGSVKRLGNKRVSPEKSGQSENRIGTGRRRAAVINLVFTYATVAVAVVKGIILVPWYLQHFSLSTYGAWLAAANVLGAFGLFETGLNFVFRQRLSFAFGCNDAKRFVRIAGSGSPIFFVSALVLAGAGVIIAPYVPTWTGAHEASASLSLGFALAAVGVGLTLLENSLFSISYAWQKTFFVGVARLGGYVVEIIIVVIFLWAGWGVASLGIGMLIGGLTCTGAAFLYIWREWRKMGLGRPIVVVAQAIELAKTTAPVFLMKAGSQLTKNSDELITAIICGPQAAAVLALTRRGFDLSLIIANSVAGSVFSGLAHAIGEQGASKMINILREIFAISAVLTALTIPIVMCANQDFVGLWLGPDKFGGFWLNLALAASSILVIRQNLLGSVVPAFGEIRKTAYCGLAEVIIRIPLTIILILQLGLVGVPIASVLSISGSTLWFQTILLGGVLGSKKAAIQVQMHGIIAILLVMVFSVFFSEAWGSAKSWPSLVAKSCILGALAIALAYAASSYLRSWARVAVKKLFGVILSKP